jgi:hypothetical protein
MILRRFGISYDIHAATLFSIFQRPSFLRNNTYRPSPESDPDIQAVETKASLPARLNPALEKPDITIRVREHPIKRLPVLFQLDHVKKAFNLFVRHDLNGDIQSE